MRSGLEPADNAHVGYSYSYEGPTVPEERDWRRLPGFADVSEAEWMDPLWQRKHSVTNVRELRQVYGSLIPESLLASVEQDQRERATMSLLVPPEMLNTMDEGNLWQDPIRRYMLPARADRDPEWPTHPTATRDSLHESEMWAVEGLTHRYPTKVLAELLSTCSQYCGHCTRMDLVGKDVPQVAKYRFQARQRERHELMLDYVSRHPEVRDVVVSGGDVANVPFRRLEDFVSRLVEIRHVRDVRLASKAVGSLPQHFLQDEVLKGLRRLTQKAADHDVDIAIHTHINHANTVTSRVRAAVRRLREVGIRDVRNQGVLLRGVNASVRDLLDLCFRLVDYARITPYYFYMCDIIPNSEHWRTPLAAAQDLQDGIQGYLPGFSTPRIVCDVPLAGKRLVHQARSYDRTTGISTWTKSYVTPLELRTGEAAGEGRYEYFDPMWSLPSEGKAYWRRRLSGSGTRRSPRGMETTSTV